MEGELSEMTGVLRQMLAKQDMGAAIPYMEEEKTKNEERNTKLDEIRDIMQTLSDDFKEEMDNAEDYAAQIKEVVESLREAKGTAGEATPAAPTAAPTATMGFDNLVGSMSDVLGKDQAKIAKSLTTEEKLLTAIAASSRAIESQIRTLTSAATTKGSIHTQVDGSDVINVTNSLLEAQIKERSGKDIKVDVAQIGGGAGGGTGGGSGPGSVFPTDGDAAAAGETAGKTYREHFYKAGIFGTMAAALAGLIKKFSPIEHLFKGVVQDELEFMQNMRATAFEVEGISASTRGLQEEWQQTGRVVARTGMNLTEFQTQYVKNLRAGVISQKAALDVTKTGLHLSQMIGANHEQTSDTLMNWHKTMGMNQNQMAQFSRSLQDVARLTGVTGDNLMEAVKASEELVKNMRNAGQLTAAAAANLTSTMASAQKLGVAEGAQEIMKALTGTNALLQETSKETQTFLFNAGVHAGRFGDVWSGTISQTKAGMKDLAGGMKGFVESVMGQTMDDFDKLSKEEKAKLNFIVKNVTGKSIDEARRIIESIEEGAKTYGDRISDINKRLREETLTLEERKKLEEDRLAMQIGGGFEFLTAFDEAAKKGLDMSAAVQDAMANNEDLAASMGSMGLNIDMMGPTMALEKAALFTAERLKEAGGADFTPQIQRALDTGDTQAMREVLSDMSAAQQELAMDTKKGLDPMTEMAHNFNKLNETVRDFTGPALRYMSGMMMWLAVIAGGIGSVWTAALGFGELKKGLAGLFGMGGGAGDMMEGMDEAGIDDVFKAGLAKAGEYVPQSIKDMFGAGLGKAKDLIGAVIPGAFADSVADAGLDTVGDVVGDAVAGGVSDALTASTGSITTGLGSELADGMTSTLTAGLDDVGDHFTSTIVGNFDDALGGVNIEDVGLLDQAGDILGGGPEGGKAPSFDWGGIEKIGEELKKAAPTLIKAAIGLAIAAAAVVLLIKVLQAVGIGPKEAMEGAITIAVILGTVALIAGAVYASVHALKAASKMWGVIKASYKDMLIGAAVIGLMGPAIVLLATAIVFVCKEIMGAFGMDASTVAKTAIDIAAILGAAAAITIAAAAGVAAIMGVGAALGLLTGPQALAALAALGIGVAAILLAVPLLLTLAAGVVRIAQGVMSMMGVDAAVAVEVGKNVAALLGATALIIIGTAAGLAALWGIGKGIMAMFTGGLALKTLIELGVGIAAVLIAVPILLTIAAAVVKIAQGVLGMMGVDAGVAMEVAKNVGGLLIAAAGIITGVGLGLAALWGIGKGVLMLVSGPQFLATLLALGVGTAAVLLATPILLGIAAAVVKIAQGVLGAAGVDAATAAQVGEDVSALLKAAAGIVIGVGAGLAALYGMGWAMVTYLAGPQALVALGMMALGAVAVRLATPIMLGIAADVVNSAKEILKAEGMDAGAAAKVAEDVKGLLTATVKIVAGVASGIALLTGIGWALGLLSGPLALGLILSLAAGAAVVRLVTPMLIKFAASLLDICKAAAGAYVDPAESQKVVAAMDGMGKAAKAIANMLGAFVNDIVPLTQGWFLGWFGASPLDELDDAMPQVEATIDVLANFLGDLMRTMSAKFPDEGQLAGSIEIINSLGTMASSVADALGVAAEELPDLTDGWFLGWFGASPLDELAACIPQIKSSMDIMSKFLGEVMVDSLGNFPSMDNMTQGIEIIKNMGEMSTSISAALGEAAEKLPELTEGGWIPFFSSSPLEKLEEAIPALTDGFETVAKFMRAVIGVTHDVFSDPDQAKKDVELVTAIGTGATAVAQALTVCGNDLVELTEDTGWFGWGDSVIEQFDEARPALRDAFKSVARFMRDVITIAKAEMGDIENVQDAIDIVNGMGTMAGSIAKAFSVIGEDLVPMTEESGWGWWSEEALTKQLEDAIPDLEDAFGTVAGFLGTCAEAVMSEFPGEGEVKTATDLMTALGPMVDGVADAMKTTSFEMVPLAGWSGIENLEDAIPELRMSFRTISRFLGGIVETLKEQFPSPRDVQVATSLLENIGIMVESVAKALEATAFHLLPLIQDQRSWLGFWTIEGTSLMDKLVAAVPELQAGFTAVATFLGGIIRTLQQQFPAPRDVQVATLLMENLAKLTQSIALAMETAAWNLIPLTKDSLWIAFWTGKRDNSLLDRLQEALPELDKGLTAVLKFLGGIVRILQQQFPAPRDVQVASLLMHHLAILTVSIASAMRVAANQLIPLTQDTGWLWWWREAPLTDLEEAIPDLDKGLRAVIKFLGGIVDVLQESFPNPRDVQVATLLMENISKMTFAAAMALRYTAYDLLPLVQDRKWLFFWRDSSPLEELEEAIPDLQRGMHAVIKFLGGIIDVLKESFPNPRDVQVASLLLTHIGIMTAGAALTLREVAWNLLPLIQEPSWLFFWREKKSLLEKLQEAIPDLQAGMRAVFRFLGGIIDTLKAEFPEPRDVLVATNLMSNIATLTKGVSGTLGTVAEELIPLTQGRFLGWWGSTPLEDLEAAIPDLQEGFRTVMKFFNSLIGLMKEEYPDFSDVATAGVFLMFMADVAKGASTLLNVVAEELQPLTERRWFGFFDSKLAGLEEAIPTLEEGLGKVMRFIRDGVIEPLRGFARPNEIQPMVESMVATVEVVKNIPRFLEELVKAIEPLVGGYLWSPIDGIEAKVTEFAENFGKIAWFMLDAVITPLHLLPAPEEILAINHKLAAMCGVFAMIPVMLESFTKHLGELSSGYFWSPIDGIESQVEEFATNFYNIIKFMDTGIIIPLQILPPVEELYQVIGKLVGMSSVISTIPILLNTFTETLGGLTSGWFWSPLDSIESQSEEFAENFGNILHFMQTGIMDPLFEMPEADMYNAMVQKLTGMKNVIEAIPPVLASFTEGLAELTQGWFWSPLDSIEAQADEFAENFGDIIRFFEWGMIYPLMMLPSADAIGELHAKLPAMDMIIQSIPPMLASFTENLSKLTQGWFWSPLDSIEAQAEEFAENFGSIAMFFRVGMVYPLMLLPSAETIGELQAKLPALTQVIQALAPMLTTFAEELGPFAGGWFWSPLDSIESQTEEFAENFGNIARFINEGVLEPLKLLPEATEIEALAASVEALAQVFGGLSDVLVALAEATATVGETDLGSMDLEGVKEALTTVAGMSPALTAGGVEEAATGGAAGGAVKMEPVEKFAALAKGGTFVANEPTALLVGEAGPERVIVSPLEEAGVEALQSQMAHGGTAGGIASGPPEVSRAAIDAEGIMAASQQAQTEVANAQAKARHINEKIMNQIYSEGVTRHSENMKTRANEARSETLHNVTKTKDHLDKSLGMMKGGMTGFFENIGGFFQNLKDNFFGAFGGDEAQKAMHDAEVNAMKEAEASGRLRDIKVANAAEEAGLSKEAAAARAAEEAAARELTDEQKTGLAGVESMAAKRPRKEMTPEEAVQEHTRIQTEQSQLSTAEASRALRGGAGSTDLADLRAQYRAPRTGYKRKRFTDPTADATVAADDKTVWTDNLPPEQRARMDERAVWTSDMSPEQKAQYMRRQRKGDVVGGQPLSEWTDPTANLKPGESVSPEQQAAYFTDLTHGVHSRSGNTRVAPGEFDAAMADMTPDFGAEQARRQATGKPTMTLGAARHEQFGVDYGSTYDPGLNRRAARYEQSGTGGSPVDRLDRWGRGTDRSQIWEGMAAGGSFVAQAPTPLMVGEAGPERVTVTPATAGGIPDLEDKVGMMAAAAAGNALSAITTLPFASQVDDEGVAQPQVESAPLTDVYDRMHQEQIGAEAGPTKLNSSELTAIEDASMQQVDHLATMSETLVEIKGLLTPNTGSSLSGKSPQQLQGSTAPNTTTYGSTDYGKWQFGRHAGNAANQVINDGVN